MTVIYYYLERKNCEALKFHKYNSSYLKTSAFFFKRRPPVSVAP